MTIGLSMSLGLFTIASMSLFSRDEYIPFCGIRGFPDFLFPDVVLNLAHPVTVDGFRFPENNVEIILARMEEAGNTERIIYGRIRVNITEPSFEKKKSRRIEMKGNVESIDFFLNQEMTKLIGSVQLTK